VTTGPEQPPLPHPLHTLVTGLAMGAAEVVPGFSGGTVALVAGLYARLIANVGRGARLLGLVVRLRWREVPAALRAVEWPFVLVLLSGNAAALFTLAAVLERLLDARPVTMSGVFLGLVLGAAWTARRSLRAPLSRSARLAGVATALLTFALLGVRPVALADPALPVLALAGAVAVCAMILPGVSGSFLLLVLGVYEPIIAAVAGRDLVTLAVVAGGMVVGLALFAALLDRLLRRHHDRVLALLIGLMVGSSRALWPWPSATGVGDATLGAPEPPFIAPVIAAAIAAAAVVAVGRSVRGREV
jgi:putative membrane protein